MKILIKFLGFLFPVLLSAQNIELYVPRNMAKTFELQSRSKTGEPGVKYWQNKPSYKIDIEFDPQTYWLTGQEDIKYTNNSPDTLKRLTITLLGDIYNKNNYTHDWGMNRKIMNDGVVINKMSVRNTEISLDDKKVKRSGTNMYIDLEKPLEPNTSIDLSFEWKYRFPLGAVIRSGNYGDSTFMITYFYPKIAVYDDVDGWDRHNYTGYGEFYGEYADYDVNITVPGDFKVWATGELQNPEKVLSPEYLQRWKDAHQVGKMVSIITKEEVEKREVTLPKEKLTWHYKAKHVTDFALGTSNRFRWDAKTIIVDKETGRKTFLCTAYAKDRKYYPRVINLLDTVLTNYSNKIPGIPFPFPSMKIFNGNAGMEFPMMCNDAEGDSWVSTVGLTYHEVGHSYFPFYVGTNERKYAWMDEGWATFFPSFYIESHLGKDSDYNYLQRRMYTYAQFAGSDLEVPVFTPVDLLRIRKTYRQASYNKPFLAYYYLMNYLGDERFLKAQRGYMKRWAGKHPMPFDYFNSINNLAGENMNWFWKNWFFDFGYADMAISLDNNILEVKNIGHLALPVVIKIDYKDGTSSDIALNMKVWKNANNKLIFPLKRFKEITKITLGEDWIVDVDKTNNVIEMK